MGLLRPTAIAGISHQVEGRHFRRRKRQCCHFLTFPTKGEEAAQIAQSHLPLSSPLVPSTWPVVKVLASDDLRWLSPRDPFPLPLLAILNSATAQERSSLARSRQIEQARNVICQNAKQKIRWGRRVGGHAGSAAVGRPVMQLSKCAARQCTQTHT